MTSLNKLIEQAALSYAQAKERVIVDCINELIKKNILVFYDQQMSQEFDQKTNILTHKGTCLLRESDDLLAKLKKLTELKKENKLLKAQIQELENKLNYWENGNGQ